MKRRDILRYAGTSAAAAAAVIAAGSSTASAAGGKLNAVWVHGTSAVAEDENQLKGTERVGWGTNFTGKAGVATWFHISIPTPVIVNDVRPTLEKVFLLFKTNGATIRNIHIYDGAKKVRAFDNLNLKGDLSQGIGGSNAWALPANTVIGFGLGISIGVQFAIGFDSTVPTDILFSTAGADFRLA